MIFLHFPYIDLLLAIEMISIFVNDVIHVLHAGIRICFWQVIVILFMASANLRHVQKQGTSL